MPEVVGEAFVAIRPQVDGFANDAKTKIAGPLQAAFAGIGTAVVGREIGQFFRSAFDEATDAAKVTAQVEAALKSTGGAANVTAKHIEDYASESSDLAAIDDELIAQGEAVLLTFTKVRNETGKGNDVFDQATLAALNMSAALGTDLQGSIIQVGKALNDPIAGLTSLTRAGVQFTEQQKEQIRILVESGDTLGAQKIILKELETQFGGAAKSQATDAARLQVAFGNLKESIGTALLPVVNGLAKALQPLAEFLAQNKVAATALAIVISGALMAAMVAWTINAARGTLATLGFAKAQDTAAVASTRSAGSLAGLARGLGVAGAIMGAAAIGGQQLAAALGQTAHSLDLTATHIDRLTDRGLRKFVAELRAAPGFLVNFNDEVMKIAATSTDAARRMVLAADLPREAREKLLHQIDKEEAAQKRAAAAAGEHAAGLDDVTDSLKQVNDYLAANFDASLDLEESQLRVDQAIQSLNETLFLNVGDLLEVRGRTLDAKGAIADYGNQAKATAELAGRSSTEAAQAQVDALSRVAAQIEPGSPLRVWLDQYIGALRDGIPDDVYTTLHARFLNETGMSQEQLDAFVQQNINLGVGLPPEFALGGTVPGPVGKPTLAIVHGGEEVIPYGETRSGGGGDVIFNISGGILDPISDGHLLARTYRVHMQLAGR